MPQTIHFHLDESCDPDIADALRRRGIEVTTAREAGLLTATDEDHLVFARTTNRVLFTQDADFLRFHAAGFPHGGIVFCQQQRRSLGDIIRGLIVIWEILEPEDMRNKVEFL